MQNMQKSPSINAIFEQALQLQTVFSQTLSKKLKALAYDAQNAKTALQTVVQTILPDFQKELDELKDSMLKSLSTLKNFILDGIVKIYKIHQVSMDKLSEENEKLREQIQSNVIRRQLVKTQCQIRLTETKQPYLNMTFLGNERKTRQNFLPSFLLNQKTKKKTDQAKNNINKNQNSNINGGSLKNNFVQTHGLLQKRRQQSIQKLQDKENFSCNNTSRQQQCIDDKKKRMEMLRKDFLQKKKYAAK